MALQRSRPVDTMQRVMNSFKHFEKKLDKLQSDVDYQGRTLNDLRSVINNLSLNTVFNPDGRSDEMRRSSKKSTAIQYENRTYGSHERHDQPSKIKRKNAIQPLPSKLKPKSFKLQKNANEFSFVGKSINKQVSRKRSPRPRKIEPARKSYTGRNKVIDKNHSKMPTKTQGASSGPLQ